MEFTRLLLEGDHDGAQRRAEIVLGAGEAQRTYDLYVSPLRGHRNQLIGRVALLHDVTGRKQAEEALRESEEKYRNVVERANDGLAIIQDTVVQYANPRLAAMRGDTVEEIVGTAFTKYVHPDEFLKVVDRSRRRLAGEEVSPIYETVLLRADGSKVYAELNAGTITYQGRPADLVIVRDITERRRAEQVIRDSELKYRTLFEASTDAIFLETLDGPC